MPVPVSGSKLLCDVSTGVLRPLVPEPMRRAVFESIHQVSHPSKQASWRLISQSFVWEFLSRDVNLWAQSCICCQQSKVQTYLKTPLQFTIFWFRDEGSPTYMWTWLDLYLSLVVFLFCSLSLMVPQDGQANPSANHYSRRLFASPPMFMDPSFWSPFGNNLLLKCTIY